MNTISTTTSLLTHALAWALLYSLWQGALIYGSLYLLLKASPNAGARAKYYISFSALTAICLWFADTWSTQYQKLKGVTVFITQASPDGGFSKTFTVKTIARVPARETTLYHLLPRLEQYFPFLLSLYTAGLVFMLFRFTINILQLRALKTRGIIAPGEDWQKTLQYWQNKFEIARPVKLYFSERVNVPMMLGALKPIILLPVAAINHLSTEQVEAILMHELAHIKRHDYLLNIFQTIAETVLFFNPFVWLVSGIIRREREHCCDDMVVSCAASPLPYARALAILETNRITNNNGLVLAATGQKNQLLHRIKRIMEMKKNNINYGQLTIIVVAILAVTFSIAMFTFTPSFAQKAKGDSGDTTVKKKSVYKYKSITIDSNGKKTEIEKQSDKPMKEMSDEEDNGADIDITVKDDSAGKHTITTRHAFSRIVADDDTAKHNGTKSYSYSFSNDDSDNFEGMASDVFSFAMHAHGDFWDTKDGKEVEELANVDWNKIDNDIKKSLREIDLELSDAKINNMANALSKEALTELKKALESDESEMTKNKQRMAEVRAKAGKAKAIAIVGDDGGAESTDYEAMLIKMEQDQLIDRSKSYRVAKKNGALYINGEKQPDSVFSKYSEYLKDKAVNIKGSKGNLSISVDN